MAQPTRIHTMRLVGAVLLLLFHVIRNVYSAEIGLDGSADTTKPQTTIGDAKLVTAVDILIPTLTKDTDEPSTFSAIDGLVEMGCYLNLSSLETVLKERRALAGDDSGRISEHYNTASIIMTYCPSLADAKTAVQQALDTKLYEILRCLARHPIWKDRAQERWYWGMISDTPAFNPTAWVDELRGLVFKTDNPGFYEMMRYALSLDDLPTDELHEYIIIFDAVNILAHFYPVMINEIATRIDLIIDFEPPRIINTIINSAQNLDLDTSHIAPRNVASPIILQYLFFVGYNQIPKLCQCSKKNIPTIRIECMKWLVENNCLSLVQTLFQKNPHFNYDYDVISQLAIKKGSIDVLKWLHARKKTTIPPKGTVCIAAQRGHLTTIEWVFTEFGNQVDWNHVITECCMYPRSYKVVDYLENIVTVSPEVALYRLAAKGDLQGLQTAFSKSTDNNFPWTIAANGAAKGGHVEILKWVYIESNTLPESRSVEVACRMGHFSVLFWIFEIDSTRIAPKYHSNCIDASICILYAAMHSKPKVMEWILCNPLKNIPPSARVIYETGLNIPEEAYIKTFEWVAAKIEPTMMLDTAVNGHVQIFQWLHKKGLSITSSVMKEAANSANIEILKAIHAIDPLLVCTVEIANSAARFWTSGVWMLDILNWFWRTCRILPTDLSDGIVREWVADKR